MPTRKKPREVPSLPGLASAAPVVELDGENTRPSTRKSAASTTKSTKATSSKKPATKSTKAARSATKTVSNTIAAAKGKAKAQPGFRRKSTDGDVSEIEVQVDSSPESKSKYRKADAQGRPAAQSTGEKRKTNGDAKANGQEDVSSRPSKKARTAKEVVAPKRKAVKPPPPKVVINNAPRTRLDVYVCGEGSAGELGLGNAKGVTDVKRPRLNPHLKAGEIGVVHVKTGGMHAAALTHDNRILTWGVNDQGALGRDTHYEGGLRDIDDAASDSSENSNDIGLNPREATPTAIPTEAFPDGTTFTQLAAGDSCTFALTDDGLVYGWGTFRAHDGIMGFFGDKDVQRTPTLIPGLKKITQIVCGANHAIALDTNGQVLVWGCGEQAQLGYRHVERTKLNGLKPGTLRIKGKVKMTNIGTGSNHAFSVDDQNNVWTWGSNSFGQTGVQIGAGEDNAVIFTAEKVPSLRPNGDERVVEIAGGMHHSIAVTSTGKCLVWGRIDGQQTGIDTSEISKEDYVVDARNNPRILTKPTAVKQVHNAQFAAAGTDHCIALDGKHEAYTWGFSANYQTGLGTSEDVAEPTKIDNTATRGKKLTWAGAGGQYSILAGPHVEV